ncbi:MAG: 50S ribosomal protein L6, partial [bacterium]
MSRIGKNPIAIPAKTEVKIVGNTVTVKGPLGELVREVSPAIKVEIVDGNVILTPVKKNLENSALWGTYASHIRNMVEGVNKAYEKKLIIEGIG